MFNIGYYLLSRWQIFYFSKCRGFGRDPGGALLHTHNVYSSSLYMHKYIYILLCTIFFGNHGLPQTIAKIYFLKKCKDDFIIN